MENEDSIRKFLYSAEDDHYIMGLVKEFKKYDPQKRICSESYLGIKEGEINEQYQVMVSLNGFLIYDQINQDSVIINEKNLENFLEIASEEIFQRLK